MATTATTPNSVGRHSALLIGNNQRKHSVRTGSRSVDRPNAPVFLEEPLFLQSLSHGAVAGPSKPSGSKIAAPQFTGIASLRAGNEGGLTSNNNHNFARKRTATEVLDLTHTTTISLENENDATGQAGRPVKRLKMPFSVENGFKPATVPAATATANAATEGAKRKMKKAERAERQEKLAQESALWRAKYKKAFPSFTFYFDAIDETTKAQLGAQVKKLGSVRRLFFDMVSLSHDTDRSPGDQTSRSTNSSARKSRTS